MLTTLIATAIVLGVLIFVHELGHFLTAKWADIEVPRFSIGFGPRILGFRRGETEYVISLLPLGGYVKMAGMEELETIEGGADADGKPAADGAPAGKRTPGPRDFESKSLGARTLVISAGVIMNLAFAVLAFSFIALRWGMPVPPPPIVGSVAEEILPPGAEALADLRQGERIARVGTRSVSDFQDVRLALASASDGPLEIVTEGGRAIQIRIPESDSLHQLLVAAIEPPGGAPAVIETVNAGGPAELAGVEPGDRVIVANGRDIETWQQFVTTVEAHPGEPVDLVLLRGADTVPVSVTPQIETQNTGRAYGRIGVGTTRQSTGFREQVGPLSAVAFGFSETLRWVRMTLSFLAGLFSGEQSPRDLGGPIAIGQISGQAARAGLEPFLSFMALLSVNLAVLNLLPIPVLDGGQLLFLLIEGVRGRALSMQQRIRWSQVGFLIILAIMIFAIGNDVLRWIGF